MADKRADKLAGDRVAGAMNLVLQAEQEAERAIAGCERQAAEIAGSAHQRANRIAARADERITMIKMRCSQRVAGEIGELERAEKSARERMTLELDESDLGECLEAVSTALTEGQRT